MPTVIHGMEAGPPGPGMVDETTVQSESSGEHGCQSLTTSLKLPLCITFTSLRLSPAARRPINKRLCYGRGTARRYCQ